MSGDERELRVAWRSHVGGSPAAESWFDTILGFHRDPSRHYHGVRHVVWVVRHGSQIGMSIDPPLTGDEIDRVVAAGFFHDAVYDASSSDNEAASSRLAAHALAEIGWSGPAIGHVARMIDATAGHDAEPSTDRATQVLLAADLAVLAAEPAKYDDYTRAVRREYRRLDDATWRAGRSAFIRSMLERPTIFPSGLQLVDWERRARANLTAELAALG